MFSVKKLEVADEIRLAAAVRSRMPDQPSSAAGGVWLDVASRARTRLWELPPAFHCSVVGTCLTLAEARKFVARRDVPDALRLSDLEFHEHLVLIAANPDGGARELNKYLDRRHGLAIRRFDKAKEEEALLAAWQQALANGDIPGAYWAALTHRSATQAFRAQVFGDVHMLSHLVGAANRADVRRLGELERENAELKEKVERQQARLRDLVTEKQAVIKELEDRLATRLEVEAQAGQDSGRPGETDALRRLALSLRKQLDQKSARVDVLAEQGTRLRDALARARDEVEHGRKLAALLTEEMESLEAGIGAIDGSSDGLPAPLEDILDGRTVFYCGGRPGHVETIRRLVEKCRGTFLHHDGGKEERMGLMASQLQGADIVVFPVDCVSHDAMGQVKRLCRQSGKAYRALRTSSLGSFVHALRDDAAVPA